MRPIRNLVIILLVAYLVSTILYWEPDYNNWTLDQWNSTIIGYILVVLIVRILRVDLSKNNININ